MGVISHLSSTALQAESCKESQILEGCCALLNSTKGDETAKDYLLQSVEKPVPVDSVHSARRFIHSRL